MKPTKCQSCTAVCVCYVMWTDVLKKVKGGGRRLPHPAPLHPWYHRWSPYSTWRFTVLSVYAEMSRCGQWERQNKPPAEIELAGCGGLMSWNVDHRHSIAGVSSSIWLSPIRGLARTTRLKLKQAMEANSTSTTKYKYIYKYNPQSRCHAWEVFVK